MEGSLRICERNYRGEGLNVRNVTTIIKQSLPVLLLLGIGQFAAGNILSDMIHTFKLIPGLIVIVPSIIGLRGNISSCLGARLGSAVHLGLIDMDKIFNDETKENIRASIGLSMIMSMLVGIVGYIITYSMGFPVINPFVLTAITFITGTLAGVLLAFTTVGIIAIAVKVGVDPDNVTEPALATIADVVTLLSLFATAILIGGIL